MRPGAGRARHAGMGLALLLLAPGAAGLVEPSVPPVLLPDAGPAQPLAENVLRAVCEAAAPLGGLKLGIYRAIWEVQGDGPTSPYEGESVDDVRGVVTADFQRGTGGPFPPWGFFLQAYEPDCRPETSDGIFVYTGSRPKGVRVGDLVELDGALVTEYGGPASFPWERTLTELVCGAACQVDVLEAGMELPEALDYAPPADEDEAAWYQEALEGMLVEVRADATVVAPPDTHDEMVVARGAGRDRFHAQGGPAGERIVVEGDGIAAWACGQDGLGDARTFDLVPWDPAAGRGIRGPLTYGFDVYKVQQDDQALCPVALAGDRSSWDPGANPPPLAGPGTFTLATLNAWNLFDAVDDPAKADDVPSASSVARKARKLAAVLCDAHALARPDVVALQEVEGLGPLQRVAQEAQARCGMVYEAHTRPAPDDRGIENAFLVARDRVRVLQVQALQGCSARDWGVGYEPGDGDPGLACGGEEPHFLHPRPPLELVAEVLLASGPVEVRVLNNHLKSRLASARCEAPDCADLRLAQAEHVQGLVAQRLAASPGARVAVVGDLNDHEGSAPLQALAGPGQPLGNVALDLAGPPSTGQGSVARYTYEHRGVYEALDHQLAGGALADAARVVSIRHLAADWPGFHQGLEGPLRASDHDPLLVAYALG